MRLAMGSCIKKLKYIIKKIHHELDIIQVGIVLFLAMISLDFVVNQILSTHDFLIPSSSNRGISGK
jgi:hypothetical protein